MLRLTLLLALAACTLRPHDFGASATDTGTSPSTTDPPDPTTGPEPTTAPPTTSTTTTTAATSDTTGTTGQSFIKPMDGGPPGKQCNQWIEDCPEGQKCMPYSGDGDNSWESLKCVPIVPNPAGPGDPCMVFGSGVSGEDTCDEHAMCWDIDWDTGIGHCVAMCTGSPDMPNCDQPKQYCHAYSDGVVTLCFDTCDPLLQDCPDPNDVCLPNPDSSRFICIIDASGEEGQAFDLCEYPNACDAGLLCANTALAAECDPMFAGCCLPFCDLSVVPPPCPGKDQQCLPWYEEGQAPPGHENVGICGLPQ